jgi:hypothetical protein
LHSPQVRIDSSPLLALPLPRYVMPQVNLLSFISAKEMFVSASQ